MFSNGSSYRTNRAFPRIKQKRGVAAVEFAVILPVLLVLLTFPIFFGRVFMHYSVIHKAAHDAAIYYAGIPLSEMDSPTLSRAAADVAESIVTAETEEITATSGSGGPPVVQIQCDGWPCGAGRPTEVSVLVRMRMYDDFFNNFTWLAVGSEGIVIEARVVVPYLGN